MAKVVIHEPKEEEVDLVEELVEMGIREYFAQRAVAKGLTRQMVNENVLEGRPPHWIEAPTPDSWLMKELAKNADKERD